jgi:hypothetical protein
MELTLSLQGKNLQRINSFEPIDEALNLLDGQKHSRVLLANDDGGDVTLMGKKDQMVICYTRRIDARVNHYVLGLSKRDEEKVSFSSGQKTISVQKNELMAFEDALLIAMCFFKKKGFPEAYTLREIDKPLF